MVQKLVAGCCCAGGFLLIGFAVWNWQFNQAFGIKNPLGQSISDWWLAGPNVSKLPQALDPKIVPSADVLVTFIGFFLVFGFLYGAFSIRSPTSACGPFAVHHVVRSGPRGRPFNAYLLWGSTSR